MSDKLNENTNEKQGADEEIKKINYSDFLKDTEEIEAEIKREEEIKKQKKKEKIKNPFFNKKAENAENKSNETEKEENEETEKISNENEIDLDSPELKRADVIKERVMLVSFAVVLVIIIHLGISYIYYNNRFLPSTVINGEDCSGKTVSEVSEIMEEKVSDYQLSIVYNDIIVDELYGSDINMKFGDMGIVLQDICDHQKKISWIKGLVFESEPINTSKGLDYDASVLNSFINSSLVLSMTSTVKSENAGLEYSDGAYVIKPAVYGDEINKEAFVNKLVSSVNSLNTNLDINRDGCFIEPELTEDNKTLIKSCKEANKLIKNKIELNVTDDLFEIPVDIKKDWLTVDNTGALIFNENAFSKYMDRLDKSYSYSDEKREFETFHGDSVTVTGGDFSTGVDRASLVSSMSEAVLNDGDSRVVVAFNKYNDSEIGDSYIEVDLSNQMLWMFKDGLQILSTPVITGKDDGDYSTPEGVYRLKSKTVNGSVTENGESKNVSYLMAVNGEVAICDAEWKNLFGGVVYKTDGSEGSVYVPNDAAKTIYENCYENMPVVMYHHEIVENFYTEDSYMHELMDLIANRPEIPVYEPDESTEITSDEADEGDENNADESMAEDITSEDVAGENETSPADNGESNESPDEGSAPIDNAGGGEETDNINQEEN